MVVIPTTLAIIVIFDRGVVYIYTSPLDTNLIALIMEIKLSWFLFISNA